MIILGIESSCDDTAVAVINDNIVLSHVVSSQIEEHRPFGGVVPEIAARNHVMVIDKLVSLALKKAKISLTNLNLISATGGAGVIGGVITSVMFAKGLALANNIPFCAVNHLEGHALVARMANPNLSFPFLLFLASGGHCQILVCEGVGKYKKYGETLDDAIGEAFDKTAKILGLPYPGGPEIEKIAINGQNAYDLPNAMQSKKNCDFSLSGLKTAIKYLVHDLNTKSSQNTIETKNKTISEVENIAASFQNAVSSQIISRLSNAFKKFDDEYASVQEKKLVFAGGVAANKFLRNNIGTLCTKKNYNLICPDKDLCTDNGIMIAWAGYENHQINNLSDLDFTPKSRWPLFV